MAEPEMPLPLLTSARYCFSWRETVSLPYKQQLFKAANSLHLVGQVRLRAATMVCKPTAHSVSTNFKYLGEYPPNGSGGGWRTSRLPTQVTEEKAPTPIKFEIESAHLEDIQSMSKLHLR